MTSSTKLTVTVEARSIIEEIFVYTRETWGEDQANAYDDMLDRAFRRIQTFPEIGRVASDQDPQVPEYAVRQHVILYHHDADAATVTILRVVNPRRLR